MKYHEIILIATLAIPTSVYAGNGVPETSKSDEQLYGSWTCQYNYEENGSKMTIEAEETYVRNGRASSFGIMKAKFAPELPEIEFSLASSATWNISNGYLITTLDDTKIANLSHPELDKFMNLEDIFPNNLSESSEILELSESKLSLKSEADGTITHCTKKPIKPQTSNFEFETGSSILLLLSP